MPAASQVRSRTGVLQTRRTLSGQLGRFLVTENPNGLFQLLNLKRLFQNCYGTFGKDSIEHGAVRVAGNDDDWTARLCFFDGVINVIGRAVGQFQIEENEIELLFFEGSKGFFHCANHHPAEADFTEKQLEQVLQAFIVIDDENGRLAGFVFLENIFVERGFFDAPAAADLDGRELASLDEVVNGRQRDPEILSRFLNRQEVVHGRKSPNSREAGQDISLG